jgi:hypothetical protein
VPTQITIAWQVLQDFDPSSLLAVIRPYKPIELKPGNKYELKVWKLDGLVLKYYETKLVVQGSITERARPLLRDISKLGNLTLDNENSAKLEGMFPTKQNAVQCPVCRDSSLLIEGVLEGLDVVFERECGHQDKLQPPLFMLTNRILPDLNMLVSSTLSRLVRLGYFNGFEVVVPDFILDVADSFKGSGSKKSLSSELKELRGLEGEGKIKLLSIQQDPTNVTDEDKKILALSQLTNSILVTADQVLKDRALMDKRPTVYLPAEAFGQIKMLDEVRNP